MPTSVIHKLKSPHGSRRWSAIWEDMSHNSTDLVVETGRSNDNDEDKYVHHHDEEESDGLLSKLLGFIPFEVSEDWDSALRGDSNTRGFSKTPPEPSDVVSAMLGHEDEYSELKHPDSSPKKTNHFYFPGTKSIRSFLLSPKVEVVVSLLVLMSTLLVGLESFSDLSAPAEQALRIAEDIVLHVFAIEFFLRWYAFGKLSGRYLTRPLVIVDFFVVILPLLLAKSIIPMVTEEMAPELLGFEAFLPLSLMSNTGLNNLRLLRVLRLQRFISDMDTFTRFELAMGLKKSDVRPYQLQLARVLLTVFTLLSVSTGLIYAAEKGVNPDIPDYFTALYFGLTTLTTVGFGDITPVTFQGRLVVSAAILAGITIIPAQAAALVEALTNPTTTEVPTSAVAGNGGDNANFVGYRAAINCPSCGSGPHRVDASFCWSCGSILPTDETK